VEEDESSGAIVLACETGEPFGPREAELGTLNADGTPRPLGWTEAITENPALGHTEVWEIHNFTADAHPIHIHEVQFEVVNRESLEQGAVRGPEPGETGVKDTVIAYPDEITRVKAVFDIPGQFVWHCHIVEHEDNEMMRPYRVGPVQPGQPAS
jgi:bilirubin oxidase